MAESHLGWVTGNWFPRVRDPDSADPCNGSRPPEEHSHFSTDASEFGSYDADGQQVDNGDYVLVDDDTLSFPSHAAEFGFEGPLLVDFAAEGDTATLEVQMPADCSGPCADAYAWALSAFYEADPWEHEPSFSLNDLAHLGARQPMTRYEAAASGSPGRCWRRPGGLKPLSVSSPIGSDSTSSSTLRAPAG